MQKKRRQYLLIRRKERSARRLTGDMEVKSEGCFRISAEKLMSQNLNIAHEHSRTTDLFEMHNAVMAVVHEDAVIDCNRS